LWCVLLPIDRLEDLVAEAKTLHAPEAIDDAPMGDEAL
jgi:hypothetical protein